MSQYITHGIDLGTTNSCIARLDGDEVRVIQNSDQMNVTPSVVRVLRSGSLMVGRRAYNAIAEDPDNVAAEFKRLMGQKYRKEFPASGRAMSPEELSAEVLKSLAGDARRHTEDDVEAVVITMPAAFTALQCEATARAAQLAGLVEYPLLQEPIAAAIAYGAQPRARDQRWLVFDLGGGTLDVAVVSTREGRLSVLEHRGDNHLGGKDLDRLIVQNIFLPFLAQQFALPDATADAPSHGRLLRKLALIAEYAKIDLSTVAETVVSFIDLGDDREGTPIEAELTLTRAELEREIEPVLARALRLADDALAGARIGGKDLDRVLLVGGPTQMPLVRASVGAHLGAKVDFSLDPMTVVARGACLYGSSVERTTTAAKTTTAAFAASTAGSVSVRLAFEPVSATLDSIVAGRVTRTARRGGESVAHEVSIAAENGLWESGWLPVKDELFEATLRLEEGKTNSFFLRVRDAAGRALACEPDRFSIRHGLVVGAPPLPHTISVELAQVDGTLQLDAVFPRKTLLPAEKTVFYRAAQTLRPSELAASLAIKLWEGEAFNDPQANNWVGNMHIRSEQIRRPIPEGAEIQLHIRVDASRLISVDVFVPHLNEHFTERVYIPQNEEPDYVELLRGVPLDLETYLARLNRLEEHLVRTGQDATADDELFPEFIYEPGDRSAPETGAGAEDARAEVERLRREIEDLDIEITLRTDDAAAPDHDLAKGFVERAREIRVRLANLEGRAGLSATLTRLEDAGRVADEVEDDVSAYGTQAQRERIAVLRKELERAVARADVRGVQKHLRDLNKLHREVLYAQEWFWRDWLTHMQRPGREFVNTEEARKWLARGADALERGDREKLEEAVRWLWSLRPVEEQTAQTERALRPGLRL
ncbi:MAG TPA: Hsp70 family protein [Pyrinomonadaceae bacterium]|nr:Hsp70 family protein [Pyrinomonadaceae bacterium]